MIIIGGIVFNIGEIEYENLPLFALILSFLIMLQQILYKIFMNMVIEIKLEDDFVIFITRAKNIRISKSECIRIIESDWFYTFEFKKNKRLRFQKFYGIAKKTVMDFSEINQENFPYAQFLKG
jgi:hypothetical protein